MAQWGPKTIQQISSMYWKCVQNLMKIGSTVIAEQRDNLDTHQSKIGESKKAFQSHSGIFKEIVFIINFQSMTLLRRL